MSRQSAWPVPTAALGSVSVGTMLWRLAGQLSVTVIVKTRFALVANGVMTPLAPEPVRTASLPDPRHPTGDLRGVRETVPQLRVVDVLLYGHGYAPVGPDGVRRATHVPLQLRVGRGSDLLIDKTIDLYGDRHGTAEPVAFEKLFLSYARALGGLSFPDNPLGKGHGNEAHLPNLVSPTHPTERVATFGPIPETFPQRRSLLGQLPRERLQEEIIDIPVDFDWQYFQSAPIDQRVQSLRGDEWLELQNLSPEHAILRTTLPGGRAVARIYGAERAGVPAEVPLRIELCEIDADAGHCSLVWRGSFPIASRELAAELTVAAAWAEPNQSVAWPANAEQLAAHSDGQAAVPNAAPTAPDLGGTVRIASSLETEGAESATAEPPAVVDETPPKRVVDSTQPMTADQVMEALARAQAPFPMAPAGAAESTGSRHPSTVPGAPWSDEPAPPLPQAPAASFETVSLDPSAVNQAVQQAAAAPDAAAGAVPAAEPPPEAAPAEPTAMEDGTRPEAAAEAEGERQAAAEAEQERQAAAAAEQQRQAAEREERRRAAIEAAERAEAERATAEAEARREAEERARQQAEQEAAELARQNLRQQTQQARKTAATKLRHGIYGSFGAAKKKGSSGEDR